MTPRQLLWSPLRLLVLEMSLRCSRLRLKLRPERRRKHAFDQAAGDVLGNGGRAPFVLQIRLGETDREAAHDFHFLFRKVEKAGFKGRRSGQVVGEPVARAPKIPEGMWAP